MTPLLDVRSCSAAQLDAAATHFAEHGYLELCGLEERIAPLFRDELARVLEMDDAELATLLEPVEEPAILARERRLRLSKILTRPELATALTTRLAPILSSLIGPVAHVSRDFHAQFKGGTVEPITSYHYEKAAEYMEVHGAYLLHQDFTGASIPTSPSGLTLWVALNESPDSTLRLFPGTHRQGLMVHRMWKLDDPRTARLAPPIDLPAKHGRGVLFNALLLHGTGKTGKRRRVSCDIRFFPLCGFLGTEAHLLAPDPIESLSKAMARTQDRVLRTPLLEDLVFLGEHNGPVSAPPLSVENWVNYLIARMQADGDAARRSLERMVNVDLSGEDPTQFGMKWQAHPIAAAALDEVRRRVHS